MEQGRETYEFFKKPFEFKGKHARFTKELWKTNNTNLEESKNTFFDRLIDIYIIAPIIGFRLNRKAKEDRSTNDTSTIFAEQMIKAKPDLDYILQMIILLEESEQREPMESIKSAFKGADTKEEYERYYRLFNDYARGGVEELYERLIIRNADIDDEYYDEKSSNIIALIKRFT